MRNSFLEDVSVRGEIKEQQNKMTVLVTALIIAAHMVENNKYGERQRQHYPPSLSLDPQLLPLACGASFDQILQLGPLRLSALFTTLHLGNATTCAAVPSSTAERQFTPRRGREKSEGKRTSCIHSILLCRQ